MEMLKHEVLQVPRSENGNNISTLPPVKLFDVVSRSEEGEKCGGIGRSLVFVDEPRGFEKDLPHVERLPSVTLRFTKDSAAAGSKFAGYLKLRKKAAIVNLNKFQWRGYLYPTTVDPHEGLQCHYQLLPHSPGAKHEPARCSSNKHVGIDGGGAPPPPMEKPIRDIFEEQDSNTQSSSLGSGVVNSSNAPSVGDGSTIPSTVTSSEVSADISRHYNKLVRTKAGECDSYIYHMRRFNNWTKSVLIDRAVEDVGCGERRGRPGQLRILDMACGKGGDLGKWIRYKPTFYVGIDVAQQSLKDLTERILAGSNWNGVPVVLIEADLANIDEAFRSAPLVWTSNDKRWRNDQEVAEQMYHYQFDVVSMQFALHYMARSEDTMRKFLFFIASKLRPGGQFITTTVDARVVCEMLMGNSEETDGGKSRKCTLKDKRGRELLRLTFPGGVFEQILRRNANERESGSSFGIMYNFVLAEKGTCEDCAVEAPEWLLPLPELVRLADEAGLDLVSAENFHEFYENRTTDRNLMEMLNGTHATNYRGTMDETEWALTRYYIALTFSCRSNISNNNLNAQNMKQMVEHEREHGKLVPPSSPPLQSPGSSDLCFIPPLFCPPKFTPSTPDSPPPNWHHQPSPPNPTFNPASPTHPSPNRSALGDTSMEEGSEAWPASPIAPPPDMAADGIDKSKYAPPESPPGSPPSLGIHQYSGSGIVAMTNAATVENDDAESDDSEWEAMEMLAVVKELKQNYGEEVWAKRRRIERDAEVKVEMEKRRNGRRIHEE